MVILKRKVINLITTSAILLSTNVASAEYKVIIGNVFFENHSSSEDSGEVVIDEEYVENTHQCFGGEINSICDYNGTDRTDLN